MNSIIKIAQYRLILSFCQIAVGKKPRNPILSVIDSILLKAWKFFLLFAEKFNLIERPLIIADVIDSDVTTSGGKTRLAIKTLETH